MAAIPHGAFAARKVRENNERRFLISKMEKEGGKDKESKQDAGYSKKNSKEEGELTFFLSTEITLLYCNSITLFFITFDEYSTYRIFAS